MTKEDEFLRRANEAQKWADEAKSEKAKAAWLRIAQNWLGLVRGGALDEEASERSPEQRDSHEEESIGSH